MPASTYQLVNPVGHAEGYKLIDALARGWGIACRCRGCGLETRRGAEELMRRFWRHLDQPLDTLFARAVCSGCSHASLSLYAYQSHSPLRRRTYKTHERPDEIADMEAAIREWALNAKGPANPSGDRAS